jgi:hypothetical protein
MAIRAFQMASQRHRPKICFFFCWNSSSETTPLSRSDASFSSSSNEDDEDIRLLELDRRNLRNEYFLVALETLRHERKDSLPFDSKDRIRQLDLTIVASCFHNRD